MTKSGNILVVDDNKSILTALDLLLTRYFKQVETISSPKQIDEKISTGQFDLVLLDMNFSAGINSGNEGLFWLSRIKKIDPAVEVVLFTAYGDIDLAVRAIKEGAADFIEKPFTNEKLIATLQAALSLRKSKKEVKHLKQINRELNRESAMCWGKSSMMQELRSLVKKVSQTDANILITGENGTGKEVLAREIHMSSPRSEELMVSVDMGALTESLFESELFGHVKGAFTDARQDRAGKFEAADKGTLFLDEIGNLPLHLQSKLLTALQSRHIVRVGKNDPIPVDIRLISATNRNLHEMVSQGTFREDLLYRINTIHIHVPPLRQRPEDIIPLAEIFLERFGSKYRKISMTFTTAAAVKLTEYPWYGNIRELEHTIEKAVIMSDSDAVTVNDLLLTAKARGPEVSIQTATLEDMEMQMIREAIKQHEGNLSAVAQQLGVTRQTLYNKIKRYRL